MNGRSVNSSLKSWVSAVELSGTFTALLEQEERNAMKTRILLPVSVLLAAVLAIAACGGADEDEVAAPVPAAPTAAPAAQVAPTAAPASMSRCPWPPNGTAIRFA